MHGLLPPRGLALLGALTPAMLNGEVPRASWPWLPQLGLDFTLLLVLSARNVLYVVVLVWAVAAIVDALRYEPELLD